MTKELPRTIREIHDAYDRKALLPSELMTGYFAAMKSSELNASLTLNETRALESARSL